MPLGHLIAANAKDLEKFSSLGDTALWESLQELLKERLETSGAVDTARGHVPLEGYLLEDEAWDNILSGKELFRLIDDGECVVQITVKPSFLRKLFGKKQAPLPEVQIIDSMDSSLFDLLEEVKALYAKAAKNNEFIITTVMT